MVPNESEDLEHVGEGPGAPSSRKMMANQQGKESGAGIISYGFPFSSYIVKDVESKLKASQELSNGRFEFISFLDLIRHSFLPFRLLDRPIRFFARSPN